MIDLDDPLWKTFKGGYRIVYDASEPLKRLKAGKEDNEDIWARLWEELHHQGDVDIASYAAVPHFVQICIERQLSDRNVFGLVAVIEARRIFGKNPPVPDWLQEDYHAAIKKLAQFGAAQYSTDWPEDVARTFMAVAAFAGGFTNTGRILIEFDNYELEEVVEEFL